MKIDGPSAYAPYRPSGRPRTMDRSETLGFGSLESKFWPSMETSFTPLRDVRHQAKLSGFQPKTPLLTQQGIEISSSLLGGPAGMVLHLCGRNGALEADFRKPGSAQPGTAVESGRPVYPGCSQVEIPLEHGKLRVIQTGGEMDPTRLYVEIDQPGAAQRSLTFVEGKPHPEASVRKDGVTIQQNEQGTFLMGRAPNGALVTICQTTAELTSGSGFSSAYAASDAPFEHVQAVGEKARALMHELSGRPFA